METLRTVGGILNLRLSPQLVATDSDVETFLSFLTRTSRRSLYQKVRHSSNGSKTFVCQAITEAFKYFFAKETTNSSLRD